MRRKSAAKSRWTYYFSADNGDTESTYNYDANGNRDFGEDSVGAGNRLAFDNTWSYTYDNEGNLIKRVNITETEDAGLTWTYDYDNANHLTVAKEWDSDPDEHEEATLMLEADYAYDVFGNRIQKTVDWDGEGEETATVEKYAYDGWNNLKSSSPVGNENWDIWADLEDNGSLTMRYVRGDIVDQLFARVANSGDTLWNLTDQQGSLRDVIDNDGNVLDTITYSAFGQIDESDPEYGGRYKWTGREADVETGLQFNRARYYDADTGRWISQDPLGFDAGDSNLYRYVANRPTEFVDPSGYQVTIANSGQNISKFLSDNDLGPYGKVLVYSHVKLKQKGAGGDDDWIQLKLEKGKMAKDAHWLQFIGGTRRTKDFPVRGIFDLPLTTPKTTMLYNYRHLDSLSKKSAYADLTTNTIIRNKNELSLFDAPTLNKTEEVFESAGGFLKGKLIEEKAIADTFLVIDSKIAYWVHWERVLERDNKGVWKAPEYVVKGQQVDRLPSSYGWSDWLFWGWTGANEKDQPTGPDWIENPIPQKTRIGWAMQSLIGLSATGNPFGFIGFNAIPSWMGQKHEPKYFDL